MVCDTMSTHVSLTFLLYNRQEFIKYQIRLNIFKNVPGFFKLSTSHYIWPLTSYLIVQGGVCGGPVLNLTTENEDGTVPSNRVRLNRTTMVESLFIFVTDIRHLPPSHSSYPLYLVHYGFS